MGNIFGFLIGGHYKKVCTKCGTILEQCRCASRLKYTIYVICPDCCAKPEPPQPFEIEEQGDKECAG